MEIYNNNTELTRVNS